MKQYILQIPCRPQAHRLLCSRIMCLFADITFQKFYQLFSLILTMCFEILEVITCLLLFEKKSYILMDSASLQNLMGDRIWSLIGTDYIHLLWHCEAILCSSIFTEKLLCFRMYLFTTGCVLECAWIEVQ